MDRRAHRTRDRGHLYAGYLALLITCDLWRVAPIGFVPVFETRGVIVDQLQADSIGARAGVLAGDVLRRANGQVLQGSADWQRVRVHLDPSKPLNLEIERHGESLVASLLLPSGLSEWQSGPAHPALLAFRFAQVITLVLAFVVAYKRHSHAPALLGAMLLGSLATVSLALPMRLAAFWHALPPILSALLWLPFAASAAVGPLLLAFFAVFPRPFWSPTRLGLALTPAVLVLGWYLYAWHRILEDLGPPTGVADWVTGVFAINAIYAALGVAVLLARRRSAETRTDQRRIGVLLTGAIIGVAAGPRSSPDTGAIREPTSLRAGRSPYLALLVLAVPASFAHAILRHRLFDISLIVRQGLRYALARGFVDALIPALADIADAGPGRASQSVVIDRRSVALVVVQPPGCGAAGDTHVPRALVECCRPPVLPGAIRRSTLASEHCR